MIQKALRFSFYLLFFSFSFLVHAQKPLNPVKDNGPKSKIELIRADSLVGTTGLASTRTFYGNVIFLHKGVYLHSQQAIHNTGSNNLTAYGNIKINQGDTLTITGDTLYYDGNTRIAQIKGRRVIMTDDDLELESKSMVYNLNTDVAYYPVKGVIHQDSTVLTSNRGYYNTQTETFKYIGDVVIEHPDFTLKTDTLDYNSITHRADFNSYTTISSEDGTLASSKGYYYTDTKESKFYGAPEVKNEKYVLKADSLDFSLASEDGTAIGNVYFYSFKDSLLLLGDYGEKISSKGYTKIIGNGLMRTIRNGAVVYLKADTLIAYQDADSASVKAVSIDSLTLTDSLTLSDSLSQLDASVIDTSMIKPSTDSSALDCGEVLQKTLTNQDVDLSKTEAKSDSNSVEFIKAYGNVSIWREDFQAVGDSVNYNVKDSTFTLFKNPMIWNSSNQLEGDTITAFLSQNQLKKLLLNQNSFVIAEDSTKNYNQIKGREIQAYFDDSTQIKKVEVSGNGESIYYALDDYNKLIGLNRVQCSKMNLLFNEQKVKRISFIGNPESKLIPPIEINKPLTRLDGFLWLMNEKPTEESVLGNHKKEEILIPLN